MFTTANITTFLTDLQCRTLLDSRSEDEFLKAHIPSAKNLPILNNAERIAVGTTFKDKGQQEAVILGFEKVGPRFSNIIKQAKEFAPNQRVAIYCWRGGMRSNILAWVLSLAGFDVILLKGGYKNYRNHVLHQFCKLSNFKVLNGKTGSGKTKILNYIHEKKLAQVLDLENLASHRGSSYGAIGLAPQPSSEMFENLIAEKLFSCDLSKPILIESESRLIGTLKIPDDLWDQFSMAPVVTIEISDEARKKNIIDEYSKLDRAKLIDATARLEKKLGNLNMRLAIDALLQKDYDAWLTIVLKYYDKTYDHSFEKRNPSKINVLSFDNFDAQIIAEKLLIAFN